LQSGVQALGASGQAERTLDFGKSRWGRDKTQKTYFLKNITFFFAE
jgi:hypothetical protein